MTVTNGQAEGQTVAQDDEEALNRRAAGIFYDAGVRSDNEILRAVAATRPEIFAGIRDALEDVEAEAEAAAWSAGARQAYIEGADAAVDALTASAAQQRAAGDFTRLAETETWLALAREDQAAAVAGVDAGQLAAMGPQSVMVTAGPCCGYPEADREAGQ